MKLPLAPFLMMGFSIALANARPSNPSIAGANATSEAGEKHAKATCIEP